MSNEANPIKGAESDLQKAASSITGLLEPKTKEQAENKNTDEAQDSNVEQPVAETEEQKPSETEVEQTDVKDEKASQEETETIQEEPQSTYKVKVAGQDYDVTLDELINGYSRDADYRRKTEDLAYDKKNFQTEADNLRQSYSQKLQEVNKLMSFAQTQLNQESNVDLNKLYEEDPTEAAKIDHRIRRKKEMLQKSMEELKSKQQAEYQNFLVNEQRQLQRKMPEFSDPEKSSSIQSKMRTFLQGYGFNDQEIGSVADHRVVLIINDAMKYRNFEKSKPSIAKKIAKPGKVLSSGVKKDKNDINFEKRREKLGRLKKSGSIKDAQSIFLDMVNNQ